MSNQRTQRILKLARTKLELNKEEQGIDNIWEVSHLNNTNSDEVVNRDTVKEGLYSFAIRNQSRHIGILSSKNRNSFLNEV